LKPVNLISHQEAHLSWKKEVLKNCLSILELATHSPKKVLATAIVSPVISKKKRIRRAGRNANKTKISQ
jgi:hypothetical protein